MGQSTPLITMLVAALCLAYVLGLIAHKLYFSPIVGYLLAGVLIGPATPGYIADPKVAHELAELGVILLMFGVGLQFSWEDLLKAKKIAFPGAIGQIIIATILGWALSRFVGWSHAAGIIFGLSLSVASTVVLLRALEERSWLKTSNGKIAVGWLIVEDLAVVIALVVLPAMATYLGLTKNDIPSSNLLLSLGWLFIKFILFVLLMLYFGKRIIPFILHISEKTKSSELFRLAVLSIALGVAYGAAKLIGASFALGAFFAGMVLTESKLSQKAAVEILPLRDAFAVIFFVAMGMLLNPAILIDKPLLVLTAVLIILLGKSIAAYMIMRVAKYPQFTAFIIAISLAQIGEFSFILAESGVKLKILPAEAQDVIIAAAIISILLNPFLFSFLEKHRKKLEIKKI